MKSKKPYRDKSWLEEHYNVKRLSTIRMAEIAQCSLSTIQYWMDKHEIKIRSLSEARKEAFARGDIVYKPKITRLYQDRKWLEDKYLGRQMTIYEMAEEAKCSPASILNWLSRHGIPTRSRSEVMRQRWANGGMDGVHMSLSYRQKQSKARKKAWRLGVYDDPSIREKQSVASKQMWADGLCDHIFTEENRSHIAEGVRAAWQRGEFEGVHDKIAVAVKDAWERGAYDDRFTPEVRERISLALKQAWENGLFDERDIGGENHPHWQGGISFEPYPPTFNDRFKRKIRQRDSSTCAICRLSGKCVHHIDYDKDNTLSSNCIVLCRKCHAVTNGNREYWKETLGQLLGARSNLSEIGEAIRQ